MRYNILALVLPCALALSACTTVTPAYKDNGTRSGSCIEGGLDEVAQQFYDYQIQHRNNDLTALRPYLSDDLAKLLNDARQDPSRNALLQSNPFSSSSTPADSADVAHVQTAGCGTVQTLPAGEHHIDRVCNVPQRCGHLVIQFYRCCNTRHEITSYS